jgi:hypothetical protein
MPHPIIAAALTEADEIVAEAIVAPAARRRAQPARAALHTKTGMEVLAIQRRDRWFYRPRRPDSWRPATGCWRSAPRRAHRGCATSAATSVRRARRAGTSARRRGRLTAEAGPIRRAGRVPGRPLEVALVAAEPPPLEQGQAGPRPVEALTTILAGLADTGPVQRHVLPCLEDRHEVDGGAVRQGEVRRQPRPAASGRGRGRGPARRPEPAPC